MDQLNPLASQEAHSMDRVAIAENGPPAGNHARSFKTIVEKSNDSIVVLQDGKIVYQNPAHAKRYGHIKDEASDDPFAVLIPEDRQRACEYYQKRLRGESVPDHSEIASLTDAGEWIHAEVNASIIEHGGRPATLVMTRDITARAGIDRCPL
jgi:PAS domain S-box-containing protein